MLIISQFSITKHLKEIKQFLKYVMKKIKVHNKKYENEYNQNMFEGNK